MGYLIEDNYFASQILFLTFLYYFIFRYLCMRLYYQIIVSLDNNFRIKGNKKEISNFEIEKMKRKNEEINMV